jgi:hypothetical protein
MIGTPEQSLPYRDSNSDPSVIQPVARRYTNWATGCYPIDVVILINLLVPCLLSPASCLLYAVHMQVA